MFKTSNKIKVVMAIENMDEAMRLKDEIEDTGEAYVCAVVNTGALLVDRAKAFTPDFIVSDILLPEIDGLAAFAEIQKLGLKSKFIAVSEFFGDGTFKEAEKIGVSALVKKPYNEKTIVEKIMLYSSDEYEDATDTIKQKVTEELHKAGIPSNILGYRYLRFAIIMAVEDLSRVNSITKSLYPNIAQRFGTTSSRVERAIRHAIEIASERGNISVLTDRFSDDKRKPTNSEFISLVADEIRLRSAVK